MNSGESDRKVSRRYYSDDNNNSALRKTFSRNKNITVNDIREAAKKMREIEKLHDYVDADGMVKVDLMTGQIFCWKHLKYE
jgi:hypothetical protein